MRRKSLLRVISIFTSVAVILSTILCTTLVTLAVSQVVPEEYVDNINISTMKGWNWIYKEGSVLTNIGYTIDETSSQVASGSVPNIGEGSWTGSYVFSSKDGGLIGPINNRTDDVLQLQWAGIDIDSSADTVIFYVELPDYAKSGADWALGISGLGLRQNAQDTNIWGNINADNKYSYLSLNTDTWVEASMGQLGEDKQSFAGLPSGFKGYIRINFNDFAFWNDYDPDAPYIFDNISFIFNSIGGDCGNMVFGGIFYVPSNNTNSSVMQVGNQTYRLSNAPVNVSSVNIWYDVNCVITGDIKRTVKSTVKTAGCAYAYDWQGTHIIESTSDSVASGTYEPKWVHAPIDRNAGELMFYVELPDYENSGADWALGINGFSVVTTDYSSDAQWANMESGVKFSYLSLDGDNWIDSVIETSGNHVLPLPSGFKGYIRLNCKDTSYWNYVYDNTLNYQLENLTFNINSVGGNCGNMVFGAMYYTLTNNTNGTLMQLADKTFKLVNMIFDLDGSGEEDSNDLALLKKALLSVTNDYDALAADVNNDGAINILDLVGLKKYLANEAITIMVNRNFTAATSADDALLLQNPDRGWRLEAYVSVSGSGNAAGEEVWFNVDNNIKKLNLAETVDGYLPSNVQLVQTYFYLDDYNEILIDQNGLDRIQAVFDKAKELGIKLVVRFAYQGKMNDPTGEATDEIMLQHMKQLKPILEKNKELINVVEAGFLGAWGEWHSYTMSHDKQRLLLGIIDMVPEEIYIQVRYPEIKDVLKNSDGTYVSGITDKIYNSIGIHNDSFFGWSDKVVSGAWPMNPPDADNTDGLRQNTDNQWATAVETAAYAPIGGETFWAYEIQNAFPTGMTTIDGFAALKQFSLFRQNVFSIMHCYYPQLENETNENYVYPIKEWRSQNVTEQWLQDNSITYSPSYFKDKDGNAVERSVFEFVRDHFGYRLELQNANVTGLAKKGNSVDVEVNLANYGFSAAFNINSGFAIIDDKGNVVGKVSAGNPNDWNSRNPNNYNDSGLLIHNVKAKITLPEASGKYTIAFFAENSAGTTVNFANSNIEYVKGYVPLCELTI